MSQETFWILLSKKLAKEATDAELKQLEQLIAEHPEWHAVIENLEDLWKQQPAEDKSGDEDAYLLHLQRMNEMGITFEAMPSLSVPMPAPKRKIVRWYWAAAILLVATGVAFFSGILGRKSEPDQIAAEVNEISTRKGSKSEIRLPDGSVVWLNAGSKLTYTKDYGQQLREVTLAGEGYFDVVKMKDKPFIIHTSTINIKVLGTVFNVKAYPDDKQTETSLIRGSVEVTIRNRPNDKIILSPNEKLLVYNEPGKTSDSPSPAQDIAEKAPMVAIRELTYQDNDSIAVEASWIANKLSFKNESFSEVAKKMERWYDVTIEFGNKSKEKLLMYGTFTTESLEQALEALVFSFNFRYRIEGKKVTIY
jgi:transmembrane sensor